MKLTLDQLNAAKICSPQQADFEAIFGAELDVTEALCIEHATIFDWDWAGVRLLTPEGWKIFDTLRRAAVDVFSATLTPFQAELASGILTEDQYGQQYELAQLTYKQKLASNFGQLIQQYPAKVVAS